MTSARNTILLALLLFGPAPMIHCQPADGPRWPKHAVMVSWGRAHQFGLRKFGTYGPQRDFRMHGLSSGPGIEYAFSTSRGLIFGAMAQAVTTNWRYNFDLDDPSHGMAGYAGVNAPARASFFLTFSRPEFTFHVGKRWVEGKRFCLEVGAMAGVIPLWSQWLLRYDGYNVYPDTSTIRVFRAVVSEGLDIHPLVGFRVQGSWQARNFNRWSLMLEARITPKNYYEGDYVLYERSASEGGGSLEGQAAYIGMRLGYGVTWGAPRKPRWMRMMEKRGMPSD